MNNSKVIIITLNYNQNDYSLACIDSLLNSNYTNFQIMLIDNGSTEENTQELERILPIDYRLILKKIKKNRGYVGGINYGLEEGSKLNPDYFLIMNNDTIIDDKAITELVKAADKYEQNAIVSGKVYHYDQPNVIQLTGLIFSDHKYLIGKSPGKDELDIGQCDQEAERDSLDDVFWILPAKIVNDIGFYCNYFFLYAEQGDFAQRARRKGYKLIYTPKAKIWHKGSVTTGNSNRRALPICYWRGKSTFIFLYRNLKKKYFLLRISKLILKQIVKFIIYKGDEKKQIKASLLGSFAGIKWMFNKKPDNGYNPYIEPTINTINDTSNKIHN